MEKEELKETKGRWRKRSERKRKWQGRRKEGNEQCKNN